MVLYVLDSLAGCEVGRAVVVVGHGAERVTKKLLDAAPDVPLEFVEQEVQRGTGDAVGVALTAFSSEELDDVNADIIVLPGDTPLLRATRRRWTRPRPWPLRAARRRHLRRRQRSRARWWCMPAR